jgi:hypothetical protein
MAAPTMTTKAMNKTVSMTMSSMPSAIKSIEDRPATVVNKIWASTQSGTISGRCDIFAASAHLQQIERREIGSVQREGAGNVSNFPREITETALARVIGDKAEQAYRRGDALEKRRKLMEAWAGYCEPRCRRVLSCRQLKVTSFNIRHFTDHQSKRRRSLLIILLYVEPEIVDIRADVTREQTIIRSSIYLPICKHHLCF